MQVSYWEDITTNNITIAYNTYTSIDVYTTFATIEVHGTKYN